METIILILAFVWSILCLILFFKIWGMTSDVAEIKELLKYRPVQTSSPERHNEAPEDKPEPIEISTEKKSELCTILKKDDIIESPKFGALKYAGEWKGKHALYPAHGQALPDSPIVVRDSTGDYISATFEDIAGFAASVKAPNGKTKWEK